MTSNPFGPRGTQTCPEVMNLYTDFEHRPLAFTDPLEVIRCHHPEGLPAAFQTLEAHLQAKHWVAGFLSYEAGSVFEPRLNTPQRSDFPLLMMGAFHPPRSQRLVADARTDFRLDDLHWNLDRGQYDRSIRSIRAAIARGDVYQITYCLKAKFKFSGDRARLFTTLLQHQPVPYPAFLDAGDLQVLSLSPERFLRKRGPHILTEPMKGTWPRGQDPWSDAAARRQFARDEKNRAENVMIADLLRNDLGRIGRRVRAPKLFTVTGYRTLFQMTSTVTARIPRELPLWDLFAALFPSGSVTGAPKIRAMELIRQLEHEPRNIYTGAIGYISPERDAYFNIPIRTLLLRGDQGEMGIGGGIVWDSTPEGEWAEGQLKAAFLTEHAKLAPWASPPDRSVRDQLTFEARS